MDFDYDVVRSKRKTVGITVDIDGRVTVRLPNTAPPKAAENAIDKNREWIEKTVQKQRQRKALRPEPCPEEIEKLRQKAAEIIPKRVEYFSRLTGLNPTSVKITAAKTRFGSCSPKNGICFSLYLMQYHDKVQYHDKAVDYVVLHELAHIKHHNHSAQFYRLIEQYMPDYRDRIKMLKNI